MTREQKLESALKELEGFALRNHTRALKALEQAELNGSLRDEMEAKWRAHEAERFLLVIRERVKEAFA